MTNVAINRPPADEYAAYYSPYVSHVPEGDILKLLEQQSSATLELLRSVSEAQADLRYAPDKWSLKEVIGHISDTERIFAYRALRIARGDQTPLPGFEQNGFVLYAGFDDCKLSALARDFEIVRQASLSLFYNLDEPAWHRRGTASESEVTVRALAYIIAGHELHHVGILKERYLQI